MEQAVEGRARICAGTQRTDVNVDRAGTCVRSGP
jgi:hypothetical protein